jgi:hypothetical protein
MTERLHGAVVARENDRDFAAHRFGQGCGVGHSPPLPRGSHAEWSNMSNSANSSWRTVCIPL